MRSVIALCIVGVYALVLLAIILFLIFGDNGGRDAVADLFELTKIAVIPVVTFVIGFYFGSSSGS